MELHHEHEANDHDRQHHASSSNCSLSRCKRKSPILKFLPAQVDIELFAIALLTQSPQSQIPANTCRHRSNFSLSPCYRKAPHSKSASNCSLSPLKPQGPNLKQSCPYFRLQFFAIALQTQSPALNFFHASVALTAVRVRFFPAAFPAISATLKRTAHS